MSVGTYGAGWLDHFQFFVFLGFRFGSVATLATTATLGVMVWRPQPCDTLHTCDKIFISGDLVADVADVSGVADAPWAIPHTLEPVI